MRMVAVAGAVGATQVRYDVKIDWVGRSCWELPLIEAMDGNVWVWMDLS